MLIPIPGSGLNVIFNVQNQSEVAYTNVKQRLAAAEAQVKSVIEKIVFQLPLGELPKTEPTDFAQVTKLAVKYKVPLKASDYWRCSGKLETIKLDQKGTRWLVSEAEFKRHAPTMIAWRLRCDERAEKRSKAAV